MPLWRLPLTGDVVINSPYLNDVLEKTLPWISLLAFTFHPFNTGTPFGAFFMTGFFFLVLEATSSFALPPSLLPKKPPKVLGLDPAFVASLFFAIARCDLDSFFGAIEVVLLAAFVAPCLATSNRLNVLEGCFFTVEVLFCFFFSEVVDPPPNKLMVGDFFVGGIVLGESFDAALPPTPNKLKVGDLDAGVFPVEVFFGVALESGDVLIPKRDSVGDR